MTEKNNQSMDMDVEVTVPEEEDYLTLEFDDGETVEYIERDIIDVNNKPYIILERVDNEEYLDFFRLEPIDEDEFDIQPIESEEEYKAVVAELNKNGYEIIVED